VQVNEQNQQLIGIQTRGCGVPLCALIMIFATSNLMYGQKTTGQKTTKNADPGQKTTVGEIL